MTAKWQRNKVILPPDFSPQQREEVGERILDFIRERSANSKGKGGKQFAAYSKEYKMSLDFKNAGKSSKVNIKLSGDMLAAMDVLSHKPGELRYGFKKGTPENERADGNIRGTYGQKKAIPGKQRDFLGLSASELNNIIDDVQTVGKAKDEIKVKDVATIPPDVLRFTLGLK